MRLLFAGALLLAVAAAGVVLRLWLGSWPRALHGPTVARRRVAASAQLATWALPFAAVAAVWWLAALIAAVPAAAG
ncbi:hypothetical protein [Streptomyces sp. cg2]|uniref:hypothetical protein n=1 Tax=Streptomyces sp. cg2 TaxID=3238799 RepID=UPI0034E1F327